MSATETRGPRLEGRVALVLGASRGIGAATAAAFAAAGARLVLAARGVPALEATAAALRDSGADVLPVPTDGGDPASVEALVARIMDVYGRLDAAVNNAGDGHRPTPLADVAPAEFDRAVRVNLTGLFHALRHEIPAMLAGGGGAIVNMSSTAGTSGVKGMAGYVATKHAVIGLTRTAALDYAARGVRVNALAPGPVLTDRIAALPEEHRRPIVQAVPARRIGTVEEVAEAAVWLCSDAAAFVTGTTLAIDGGRTAGVA